MRKYKRNPLWQWNLIEGRGVLLDEKKGLVIKLDPVSTSIWNYLENAVTLEEITAKITDEYEVCPLEAEKDLKEVLKTLLKNRAVLIEKEVGLWKSLISGIKNLKK